MPRQLRLQSKKYKSGALIGALFLVLLTVYASYVTITAKSSVINVVQELSDVVLQTPSTSLNRFGIDGIDGISLVVQAVENMEALKKHEGSPVKSAILPHHVLVGEQLAEFWTNIARTTDPSVIVIIGPNHGDAGINTLQTTTGVWTTGFGDVHTKDGFVEDLVRISDVEDEPESFVGEHSIGVHAPYIAKLFPEAQIIPVIAKSNSNDQDAQDLVDSLSKILPEDALVVASTDFSHYLPSAESDYRDEITQKLIDDRDYSLMNDLGPDYLDSRLAVDAYFMWSDRQACEQRLVWHDNSGNLTGWILESGTSYLVYMCRENWDEPFVITAAGDVMLDRAVALWLAQTTLDEAFSDAEVVFADSDVAFVNLESVLSDVPAGCGNGICFEADPERVDVLHKIGITHVSVANNHSGDYGEAAWLDSQGNLTEAGIVPIGGFRNDGEVVVSEINGQKIAFLAYRNIAIHLPAETVAEQVKAARDLADTVVVSFHWDAEYRHDPGEVTVGLAHAAVDAGADIVIGHHPHVLQGFEVYNGSLIMYSLGNFVFDQIGEDENTSLVARMTISESSRTLELTPMKIVRGFPRAMSPAEQQAVLDDLAKWSMEELGEQVRSGLVKW